MTTPLRPSPLSFETGRQSPFQRQNSTVQTPIRATTPTQSPIKNGNMSPIKSGSLSPEKTSPFVRRPSQMSRGTERPSSPFGRRPASNLAPVSPERQSSVISENTQEENPNRSTFSRQNMATPVVEARQLSPSLSHGLTPGSAATVVSNRAYTRPAVVRPTTASTPTSTIAPPVFAISSLKTSPKLSNAVGGYNHVPQSLLRSMRESFEVLDSSNSGAVTSASVGYMLEQIGLDSSPAHVKDFFPPNAPAQLNLARYLDTLSGPLADLSHTDELSAAFEAFDLDDSGQIDVGELRHALLNTAPEPGEIMTPLSERQLDSVLGEFAGRRAFGAKGVHVAKSKGDVFRYRDFMADVSGGGATAEQAEATVGV